MKPKKTPVRVLPVSPLPPAAPRELTEAQLEARVHDLPARRRAPEDEVSIEELAAVLAMPWSKTEPAEERPAPARAGRITRRRALAAAMTRRAPAGPSLIECGNGCGALWPDDAKERGAGDNSYYATVKEGRLVCNVCGENAVVHGDAARAEEQRLLAAAPVSLRLAAWAMGHDPDESDYRAPEARRKVFTGLRADGQRVVTAPILLKLGPRLFRCGGELVELVGDPDPAYAEFCAGLGRPLDLENPIRFTPRGGGS